MITTKDIGKNNKQRSEEYEGESLKQNSRGQPKNKEHDK